MKICYLHIKNFKSIKELEIKELDNALILVGKNNTGKTVVIDAICLAAGQFEIKSRHFMNPEEPITITIEVELNDQDLANFHRKGLLNHYKQYDLWEKDFKEKIPSYQEGKFSFTCKVSPEGVIKYEDGYRENNPYIKEIFPKTYHIDHSRNIQEIQDEVFRFHDENSLQEIRENVCSFDTSKKCNRCFQCMEHIHQKSPEELSIFETVRLMEYKMMSVNIHEFTDKLNHHFHQNGSGSQEIKLEVNFSPENLFSIETKVYNKDRGTMGEISTLSEGLRSIYALSLLETYVEDENTIPCIIMMEDPEIFLHPQLQKVASEILYRLSKKNQVIFSTHSPNMIFNFSQRQIKQVILDESYYTIIKEDNDIDEILDDLGYTANDLMNVSFVFIVEGKQDSQRLPLLLEKYYSEIYDEEGKLQRISIIPTNSCTNIKTYANLKYINKLYLKNQFLMIRDSDGKNPKHLVKQLCSYYEQRAKEELEGNLPRVTPKNVLILKYYSFENYFLDPKIMTKIGVIRNEDEFYNTLYKKFKDYLYKIGSVKRMIKATGMRINSREDIKKNIETIKIYVRGHNLFDIFYGRYHNDSQIEILQKYIEVAPRENFKDILDAIDSFVYFENRKKE
ncbi:MAG: AAA family ATPase [Lachnospiraceae bacterium]|nr:AAA family ATPase [Lachnospiraceae bacterium]